MSHHWFLLHISGMKADKNIISSVPGPLGMSPPGPTRKENWSGTNIACDTEPLSQALHKF